MWLKICHKRGKVWDKYNEIMTHQVDYLGNYAVYINKLTFKHNSLDYS